MTRRRIVCLLLLLAAAVAGAAIAAGLFAARGRTGPLRLAYQNRIGAALCIVAAEKGFFAAEGVPVEAARFDSGPACSEALYSGAADVADMGDTTAVILASRGAPFRIIAGVGAGEHRHRLMVRQDSPIRLPPDLRGRRIAVKKGTSTYGGLLAYLAANSVPLADVKIVDLAPGDMPAAMTAGAVDAFVASEPTPSAAEERGARQLATMGGLGNTYPLVLMARDDVLNARGEDIHKLLRALRRAEAFVAERPDQTAEILARVTGLAPPVARRAMALHVYRLRLDEEVLRSLKRTAEFLKAEGQIEAVPDLSRAADGTYLPPERRQ